MNNEEIQMMEHQIRQIQQVLEAVESQLSEVKTTKDALVEFKKLKHDDEILYPVANGIFAAGKLTDNSVLKINVGSNIVVEKGVDEAIAMMEKQHDDIYKYKTELESQMNTFLDKFKGAD